MVATEAEMHMRRREFANPDWLNTLLSATFTHTTSVLFKLKIFYIENEVKIL